MTWERTHLPKLAPKTRERYESVTRTYLAPKFGSTPLGKLTRADFKEWFASLATERRPNGKSRYAPGTLRKVRSCSPPFSTRELSLAYSARPGCSAASPFSPAN